MDILPISSLSKKDRSSLFDLYTRDFPLSPWSQKYFYAFLLDAARSSLGFYLKHNRQLVGFVLGRLLTKESGIFCLSTLWVNADARGKGYGKLLVEKLIGAISGRPDIRKIILHFRDSNKLENYYSRLGFSGHSLSGTYSNGDLKHSMELIINQNNEL